MKVQFKNTELNVEFFVNLHDKNSDIHRDFISTLEKLDVDASKHLSYSSCNKLINGGINSSKGWTATVVNPEASIAVSKERKAIQRDEERQNRKAHKKALKAAKKNVANGSRNRVNAKKRFTERKKAGKESSFKPSSVAVAIQHSIYS